MLFPIAALLLLKKINFTQTIYMNRVFLLLLISFATKTIVAQNISHLKIGEKIPPIFLNNNENNAHSYSFSKMKKLIYIHFWSVNSDSSKAELPEVNKLYNEYAPKSYANNLSFDVITVAIAPDFKTWKDQLVKQQLNRELNYISQDGYCDLFVKNNKIDRIPYALLVDTTGKIILKNPTIFQVKNYLSKFSAENTSNVISGKVVTGTKILNPLAYRKIYITNKDDDTIQTIITNNQGDFTIKNEYPKNELSIKISKYPEITGTDKVFLANHKGKVIGMFIPNSNGFTYKFLAKDVFILKPLEEEEDPGIESLAFKKKLFYTEHIFNTNETAISDTSKPKLDFIVQKLKENPSFKIEIQSHTDITGSPDGNLVLSKTRAKKLYDYFLSKGIDKKRITAVGLGDKFPIIKCDDGLCTPAEIELNRRVEFRLGK